VDAVIRRQLILTIPRVGFGVIAGAIIGGILTGSDDYVILWSIGLPIVIVATVAFVSFMQKNGTVRHRRAVPTTRPGIIASAATAAPGVVLNGTVLNGVPLRSDPATAGATPDTPARPPLASIAARRVIAIGTIVVAAAVTLIPAYQLIGWSATDLVAGRPFDGKDMRVGLHQQEAMDALFDVIGSSEIYDVGFYDSYVIVSAPTYPGADTSDTYMWRYGRAFRDGPESIQPDEEDRTFDAGRIDFSIISDLVRQSEDATGWTGFTSYYPGITTFAGEDPYIYVSLGTDYYDGQFRYTLSGEFIERIGDGT
jgi:hypothetical protein